LNKRFSFPFACIAFAIIGVPLGVTSPTAAKLPRVCRGFVVPRPTTYFLFVIIGDTLRANPHAHPELLVWFPNVLFIVLAFFCSAVLPDNEAGGLVATDLRASNQLAYLPAAIVLVLYFVFVRSRIGWLRFRLPPARVQAAADAPWPFNHSTSNRWDSPAKRVAGV